MNVADYPHRPSRKTRQKASENIHGRRKTWMSLRESTDGHRDTGARIGLPWWKSPMMKEARLKKAALERNS